MADNHVFEINNLTFGYDPSKKVIKGVSLGIEEGKVTAVLGSNGSGKSTLFRLLCGLLTPTEGEILLHGTPVADIPKKEFAQAVSIVHQYNTAPEDMTVKKLIYLGRTPYHGALSTSYTEEDKECVQRAMEITDTERYADLSVDELSGGQRQRVWLAMALAQNTKTLLLDEITTYLDIYYQMQLLTLIRDLNRKYGITIVMILHDINQAMEFSDNTVIMRYGVLLANGPTREVINEENLFTAFRIRGSISEMNDQRIVVYDRLDPDNMQSQNTDDMTGTAVKKADADASSEAETTDTKVRFKPKKKASGGLFAGGISGSASVAGAKGLFANPVEEKEGSTKQTRRMRFAGFILITAGIVLFIFLLFFWFFGIDLFTKTANDTDQHKLTAAELAELSITVPGMESAVIEADTEDVSLYLYNPEANEVYFEITIVLEDTGEVIYTSDLLEPGQELYDITLEEPLAAGTYDAVLHYDAYTMDGYMQTLNSAEAEFELIAE